MSDPRAVRFWIAFGTPLAVLAICVGMLGRESMDALSVVILGILVAICAVACAWALESGCHLFSKRTAETPRPRDDTSRVRCGDDELLQVADAVAALGRDVERIGRRARAAEARAIMNQEESAAALAQQIAALEDRLRRGCCGDRVHDDRSSEQADITKRLRAGEKDADDTHEKSEDNRS